MNVLRIAAGLAVVVGVSAGAVAAQQAGGAPSYRREVPAALLAQAKISEDSARVLALTRAPGGVVQELELEREHGKLIWSFDIKVAGKPGITEVNVNALDGSIVGVEHEGH
jgi:uncharacterized membrane protein YkoI